MHLDNEHPHYIFSESAPSLSSGGSSLSKEDFPPGSTRMHGNFVRGKNIISHHIDWSKTAPSGSTIMSVCLIQFTSLCSFCYLNRHISSHVASLKVCALGHKCVGWSVGGIKWCLWLGNQLSVSSRLQVCQEGHHPCVQGMGHLSGCDANAKCQGTHRLFFFSFCCNSWIAS